MNTKLVSDMIYSDSETFYNFRPKFAVDGISKKISQDNPTVAKFALQVNITVLVSIHCSHMKCGFLVYRVFLVNNIKYSYCQHINTGFEN